MARSLRGTTTTARITKIPRYRIEVQILTGSVSSSSSRVSLAAHRKFSGVVAGAATVRKYISNKLVSSISSGGLFVKSLTVYISFISTLLSSADLIKTPQKTITAFVSSNAVIKLFFNKILNSNISATSVIIKVISQKLISNLLISGILVKTTGKTLIGSVNSSSQQIKISINTIIIGAIELYDSLHVISNRALVFLSHIDQHGAVHFQMTLFRALQGHIAASGAKVAGVSRRFISSTSGFGVTSRSGAKKFTSAITSNSSLARYKTLFKILTALVESSSVISRNAQIVKSSSISFSSFVRKGASRYLTGLGLAAGSLIKFFFAPPSPVSGVIEAKSRINVVLTLESVSLPIVNTQEECIILLEIQSLDSPELTQLDYDISLDIQPVLSTELTLTGL